VSFNGVDLGRLTRFRCAPGSAVYVESTNVTSTVLGSGDETRVVKSYDCVAVEPGSVEIGVFGCPPYGPADIGTRATVSVDGDGFSFSAQAYLDSFDVTGQVGEFLTGQAVFRIS
jgi:hypothetical protein